MDALLFWIMLEEGMDALLFWISWMLCYFGSHRRIYMRHFVNKCSSGYANQICEMCQPNFMVV